MNLAIIGSRDFDDYEQMTNVLWNLFQLRRGTIPKDTIISGGARGADFLARKYAEEEELNYTEFLPNWDELGKKAGFVRNKQIIDACDMVLAFWDGKSKGTKHSLNLAKEAKKPTFVVYF